MPTLRVRIVDLFKPIHKLIKDQQYDVALNSLLIGNVAKLKSQFKSDTNHAWYLVGDIYFRKLRFRDAITAFKKSLRTRRDDYQVLWAIGNCYSELKMPAIAERYFRKALSYEPNEQRLLYNLGNALLDQGRYQEALDSYKQVLKKNIPLYKLAEKNAAIARGVLNTRVLKDKK